jgi:hypothetical protein
MNSDIPENLDNMCDVLNQHYVDISFRDYKNFYEYYVDTFSLNIKEYSEYCRYIINDVMNKHHHYSSYLRLQKLQKINNENDIFNQY